MIVLYGFGAYFGLPDPSPFVMKAEVLLKMAGLPYRIDTSGFSKAPKGKLPYIKDGGDVIADSTFIRFHIEQKYGFDFGAGLSPEQKAAAWAFEKMAEDNLYWTVVHARWLDDDSFRIGPQQFFTSVPAPVRPFVVALVRRGVRRTLWAQGMGRHSPDQIVELGRRSISALADYLGERPFFMGTTPTGVDATIFAFTAGVLCRHFESPLRQIAEQRPNLHRYVERMYARFYPGSLAARNVAA